MITPAAKQDLPVILELYQCAKDFMLRSGNPYQWPCGYPWESLLLQDIEKGQLFVCRNDSGIYGVFAFIIGEDETYLKIDGGAWLSDTPYGTIHRIAGNGTQKGIFAEAVSYCEGKIPHLRIDTHEANRLMQHLILKHGFQKCGTIYVFDGTPRIAYEKVL